MMFSEDAQLLKKSRREKGKGVTSIGRSILQNMG